jgi:hypothetical protein
MTHARRRIVGLCFLGLVAGATSPVLAEEIHLKSWSNVIPNAARRFVVLIDFNNEAVLDRETGLVWEKSPTNQLPWGPSREACLQKNVGGRKGWRLPSISELTSLIDANLSPPPNTPILTPGHPFLIPPIMHHHGSATTDATDPSIAWAMDLGSGFVTPSAKTDTTHIWCVRGLMNADTY